MLEQQAVASAGNAETQGTLKGTQPDGKTMQNLSYFGNIEALKQNGTGAGQTCVLPNVYWGFAAKNEWQPVGDSNPCDKTENHGAGVPNSSNSSSLQADFSEGTPEGTQADTKNAYFEGIQAVLAGLSRDELIALLSDTLAGKADGGKGGEQTH